MDLECFRKCFYAFYILMFMLKRVNAHVASLCRVLKILSRY